MSRLARAVTACILATGWMLWLGPGARAQEADPSCPDSLGGLPLYVQWDAPVDPKDSWFGEWGQQIDCRYRVQSDLGQQRFLEGWVYWATQGRPDDPFYCRPEVADAFNKDGGSDTVVSETDRRIVWGYSAWHDGGTTDEPVGPAKELALSFVRQVEASAAPCPTTSSGADGSSGNGANAGGASGGTTAEGQATGGGPPGRARAVGLLAGGIVVSAVAGFGSLLVGRGTGAGASVAPAPTDTLYGGDDSIRILIDGGQLQEVHGPDGVLIGYRPLNDLDRFIQHPPDWQPAFDHPLPTPGGQATHLGGVAFQEGPDGLISSISVVLRESPVAATPAPPAAADPAPTTAVPADGPPPATAPAPSPGDLLFTAELEVDLSPWGQALGNPPGEVRVPSVPAAPAGPPPPVSIGGIQANPVVLASLTTPGVQDLGIKQIEQLFPQLLNEQGGLSSGPYAGSIPTIVAKGGSLEITLPAPVGAMPLPDLHVRLQLGADGGQLKVRKVTIPPALKMFLKEDPTVLIQRQLDALNAHIHAAGNVVSGVGDESGDLIFRVEAGLTRP